jgi:hypothetical protein
MGQHDRAARTAGVLDEDFGAILRPDLCRADLALGNGNTRQCGGRCRNESAAKENAAGGHEWLLWFEERVMAV